MSMLRLDTIGRPSLLVLPAMVLMTSLLAEARADDIDTRAVARAHGFLSTAKRGRDVLNYLHYGSTYGGHEYKDTRFVTNGSGRVPGHFGLIYTFTWDGNGWTDLAFLCDSRGNVYEVKSLDTNANFNQPFLKADITIKIIGGLLVEAFKGQMTKEDQIAVQKFVDDANAKGLLEWSLRFQQAHGD